MKDQVVTREQLVNGLRKTGFTTAQTWVRSREQRRPEDPPMNAGTMTTSLPVAGVAPREIPEGGGSVPDPDFQRACDRRFVSLRRR